MIYVVVYLLLCLLVPFGKAGARKASPLLAVVTAVLFLFVGFRWEVGCDWAGYLNIFEVARLRSLDEALGAREPGFALLNHIAHALDLDYVFINVVGSLVFFVGLFSFARREANPLAIVALSFPILIMNMPMSGVRQGIAIGLLMVAINAYRDRRPATFASIVLIASSFHQSALMFLALTPLIGLKRNAATTVLALALVAPAVYLIFADAIGYYAQRYGERASDAFGAPFRAMLLAIVGAAFFLLFRRGWRRDYPGEYELLTIASAAMLLTLPITFYNSIIGDRIGYYLIPFQLLILARMGILFRRDRLAPLFAVAPYLGLLVFFVAWTRLSSHFQVCYVPYRSILTGE